MDTPHINGTQTTILRRTVMIIALIITGLVLLLVLRAAYTLYSVGNFKRAWLAGLNQPIEDKSLVMAVLGDSTAQGIGGFKKEDGFVGQVAERIAKKAHKPVQIYNFSVTGAESGEVIQSQLPQLKKLKRVDVILVAVGPNDITHKKSLQSFLNNYEIILKTVPAEKTVISSMPPMKPRDSSGKSSYDWLLALEPLARKYKVAVAPVYAAVKPRANDFRTYGGDFYHPSKAGYKLWADAFTPEVEKILQLK